MDFGIKHFRPLATGMGEAVAKRTVLRRMEDGNLETWGDVASRVALGNTSLYPMTDDRIRLQEHIANGSILLSGRHLQHGDKDQPIRNLEVFSNCATASTSFMSYYLLLNGSGVGRSYDDDISVVNWRRLPHTYCVIDKTHPDYDRKVHEDLASLKHRFGESVIVHTVEDSREGWGRCFEIMETMAFEATHEKDVLVFDFSRVRCSGSPIRGMQNRPSSGPVPTMNAINKIATIKGSHMPRWKQAMYVDHYAAESVLVGGARRSARMATKFWRDPGILDFINIKYNENDSQAPFLWSANDSVMVDSEFWREAETAGTWANQVFEAVCHAAYFHKTGEPGLINCDRLAVNNKGAVNKEDGLYVESVRYKPGKAAVKLLAKLAKVNRSSRFTMITNPCFHEDTLILTRTGPERIRDLVGRKVEVFDGKNWVFCDNFRVTGEDQALFTVELQDGREIVATQTHKFVLKDGSKVKLDQLQVGDELTCHEDINLYESIHHTKTTGAYLKGFLIGDGTTYSEQRPHLPLYDTKYVCQDRLLTSASEILEHHTYRNSIDDPCFREDQKNRRVFSGLNTKQKELLPFCLQYKKKFPAEVFTWDIESKVNFIAGIMDADGTTMDSVNGYGYQLASTEKEWLNSFRDLLRTLGVFGKIGLMKKAGKVDFNDGYGEYDTKDCWRLTVSQQSAVRLAKIVKFERLVSLADREPKYKLSSRRDTVVSIKQHSEHNTVYCCTVDTTHQITLFNGVTTGQCGEITLDRLGSYCVIGDSVPFFCDNLDEAEESVRLITRALIRTNLMNCAYRKEVDRTNRIGVSLTGIHEFAYKFFKFGFRDLIDEAKAKAFWLAIARLSRAVKQEAHAYSKQLGVNTPHTDTTIKPAGSTSKLFNLTEGAHLPPVREYIRNVQFKSDDPLVAKYKRMGYKTRDDLKNYRGMTIVGFPTQPLICSLGMGDKLVTAPEATPEEQYKWLMLLEKYWICGTDEAGVPFMSDTGNQISFTLKYRPSEVTYESYKKTLLNYQSKIKCCAVMPESSSPDDYDYLPEETVTLEDYRAYVASIKGEMEEDIDRVHLACGTGGCPVDFKKAEVAAAGE